MELRCKAIQDRYSCRIYDTMKTVCDFTIKELIYAATLAPSGKNTQPWKYIVVNDKYFGDFLSSILLSNQWLKNHSQFICVFLDKNSSYNTEKDCLAIGASIQNILLEATERKIDTCWIGECSNYKNEIQEKLKVENDLDLMAIITVGYGKCCINKKNRKNILEVVQYKEIET